MTINVKLVSLKNEVADTTYFAYCCAVGLTKTATGVTKIIWNARKK
jgi:hypothetical protein